MKIPLLHQAYTLMYTSRLRIRVTNELNRVLSGNVNVSLETLVIIIVCVVSRVLQGNLD